MPVLLGHTPLSSIHLTIELTCLAPTLFLPLGFLLGILLTRLSYRHYLRFIFPNANVWNILVTTCGGMIVSHTLIRTMDCFPLTELTSMWDLFKWDVMQKALGICEDDADPKEEGMNVMGLIVVHVIRTMALVLGIGVGEALQPVGLTGGIACGKSTVARMLQLEMVGTEEKVKGKVDSTQEKGDEAQETNVRDKSKNEKEKDEGRIRPPIAFTIIDLDEIAHDILLPNKPHSVYNKIVKTFGTDILVSSSSSSSSSSSPSPSPPPPIDRRKLGEIIFPDKSKRHQLNSITHPTITHVMLRQILHESFFSNNNKIVCVDIPLLFEAGFFMRMLFGIIIVVATTPTSVQLQRLQTRNTDLTIEQCKKRIDSQMDINLKVQMADVIIWNNGSIHELETEVEKAREEVGQRLGMAVGGVGLSLMVGVMSIAFYISLGLVFLLQQRSSKEEGVMELSQLTPEDEQEDPISILRAALGQAGFGN